MSDSEEKHSLDLGQNSFGLGFGIGTKRVSEKGITFEFVGRAARYFVNNITYQYTNSGQAGEEGAQDLPAGLFGWDLGLQLTVGYRFGS